jgi:hypothetical protein
MKAQLILLFLILINSNGFAQAPNIVWQKTYGGSLNDVGNSICKTNDGGFIVAGETSSSDGDVSHNKGGEDVWLLKIDSLGNMEWEKNFGGSGTDYPNTIFQRSDNGYVFFATTDSRNGDVHGLHQDLATHQYDYDGWLVRTDSIGNILWQKCLGGIGRDIGMDLYVTHDDYYLVTEEVWSNDGDITNLHGEADYWLAKLYSNRIFIWGKTYGGMEIDGPTRSIELSNGTFIIAGGSDYNFGGYHGNPGLGGDIGLLNVDTSGNVLWSKCFGGSGLDYPTSLVPGNNGTFYLVSENSSYDGDITSPFYGGTDYWITEIDQTGTVIWNNSFGGSYYDSPKQMIKTSDGGLVITGFTSSPDIWVTGFKGFHDMWVVKIDSLGNFEWGKTLGGSSWDESYSIVESPDHGLVVCGFTESTDGDVTSNHGGRDLWIVKLAPTGLLSPEIKNDLMELSTYQLNDKLNINFYSKSYQSANILIYNSLGKIISKKIISVKEGLNSTFVYCSGFSSGIYFVQINSEIGNLNGKALIGN